MLKASFTAGFLLAAVATGAHAARPDYCAIYAAAAVKQVDSAHHIPRCAQGAGGPRWAADYNYHYSWCLGAPLPAAQGERDQRTAYLRACRGR